MSNVIQDITFDAFGLDTDSSPKYTGKGSSPYNLNVLKGEDGVYGEITNLPGNRKVVYVPPTNHPWLNCNVYFVLSSCYDALTRNVYYWLFSQPTDTTGSGDYEYDNRLLRFNEDTEVIDTIFVDYKNYFGLDPLRPFKDSFVLGDCLYFNPQESEPKMIHIEMAYNYTNYDQYDSTLTYVYGDYVTYLGGLWLALTSVGVEETPNSDAGINKWERMGSAYMDESSVEEMDSEFRYAFNVLKRPPQYRPFTAYGSDENVISNNVRRTMFQFAYRYKYFDNTFSSYSAFSDVTLPLHGEYYNGDIADDLSLNNYIGVNISLHSPALVKEVEVVFREASSLQVWRRAVILDRRDASLLSTWNYPHYFFNDASYPSIVSEDMEIVTSAVPQKANAQALINKNILCYGGLTEGFDNLSKDDIQVYLRAEIQELDTPEDASDSVKRNNITKLNKSQYVMQIPSGIGATHYYYDYGDWSGDWDWVGNTWSWVFRFDWYDDVVLAAGDAFRCQIDQVYGEYDLVAGDFLSAETLANNINNFIADLVANAGGNVVQAEDGTWRIEFFNILAVTQSFFYSKLGTPISALTKYRGFKTGALHPFCLFYYDESLRRWDAQVSRENVTDISTWEVYGTTAYVPMLNEYAPLPTTTENKFNVHWEITHTPPDGAKYWRWGYAGNSLCGSKFVQYVIYDIGDAQDCGAGYEDEPLNSIWIDITPLQTIKTTDTALWQQFSNSNIDAYQWEPGDRIRFITKQNFGDIIDGVYDYEIIKLDTARHRIYIPDQGLDYGTLLIGTKSLVEIYTPLKTDGAPIYYEFGKLMPIIEDSGGILCHGVAIGTEDGEDQDATLSIAASGTFNTGDIYHILRKPSYPINLNETRYHESAFYSDFYESDYWDRGRQGIETKFNQQFLNIIRHSNQYLEKTQINGLSTFEGNNFVQLSDLYGAILSIIEIGNTLKVYQRKKPSSILIGRTEYYDATGNPNIQAISDRVLGSIRYSTTDYGTEFPESISRNNRYVYGFDIYNGVMWRDSANGIFPISGRYQSAEGSGSYLMETWFKQQAKAMLLSGVDNCSVLTTWDERHKNLYVIFKDNVDGSNDTAVMFHEPSNRWICFTDMGYTPAEGWNQILELEYSILWGFEGGIGFNFDLDTRFAEFNIGVDLGTTPNVRVFPPTAVLTLSALSPSVSTSKTNSMDIPSLTLTANTPTVILGYVQASVTSFSWEHDESELAYTETTVLSIGGWPTTLMYFPSWLVVRGDNGQIISVGSTVVDGDVISLYPANDNTLPELRTDTVVFRDTKLNSVTITVTQTANPVGVSVSLMEDDDFTLSNPTYTVNIGSKLMVVGFDHNLTGPYVWKAFHVYDANGNTLYFGTGNPYGVLLTEGVTSSKTVTLNRVVAAGDILTVQIGIIAS